MTHSKKVSWTPKGDLADQLYQHCRTKQTSSEGTPYTWLDINPQDFIRDALLSAGITDKVQYRGAGDQSHWSPGEALPISLWIENHQSLTQWAKEQGQNKQAVIADAVSDYLKQTNHPN